MRTIRRPDDVLQGYLAMLMFGLCLVGWFAGAFAFFDVPHDKIMEFLFYSATATPTTWRLWVGPAIGLALGVTLYVYLFNRYKTGFQGADFVRLLRGPRMVSNAMLRSITTERGSRPQMMFAGAPVPRLVENTHFLVGGATGTGKSETFHENMESVKRRGGRMITVDPDAGFMKCHFEPGDKILNPFEARTEGWSLFNEIRNDFDCEQYAMAVIPRSPSTDQEQWNSMARTIVTQTFARLLHDGEATTERMLYWLTRAPNDELKLLLKNTPAAGCFHGAEETLGSIRTVLTRYITPHQYLPAGDFSIRDWLDNGTGNLWITWREDQLQALRPIISCWTDVTCASILSMPDDPDRALHLYTDEIDSLEKLNYMKEATTKGRKKGLICMAGVQSLAQLDDVYGKEDALTLRNCFRSIALFGLGGLDSYTAEEFSKGIGEHEVVRRRETTTDGKRSVAVLHETERLVRPSEFHVSPNLHGYMRFAGNYPVCRVKMRYRKRKAVVEPMVLSKMFSESPRDANRLFDMRATA